MRLDIFNSILLVIMCFGGVCEAAFWKAIMVYFVVTVIWVTARIILKNDEERYGTDKRGRL